VTGGTARDPVEDPLGGCFVNCGWGWWVQGRSPGSGVRDGELVAKEKPGGLTSSSRMDRFREGRFIDESVAAGGWRIDDKGVLGLYWDTNAALVSSWRYGFLAFNSICCSWTCTQLPKELVLWGSTAL